MEKVISAMLLILALHFLLQGINYRKNIDFTCRTVENFKVKKIKVNKIKCNESPVMASNAYLDNKNDANFQSNVLNVNKFYIKTDDSNIDSITDIRNDKELPEEIIESKNEYSNEPESWKYKDELVMNGGEVINGVTGYDDLIDDYFSYRDLTLKYEKECSPSKRGTIINDDLRMGMGMGMGV